MSYWKSWLARRGVFNVPELALPPEPPRELVRQNPGEEGKTWYLDEMGAVPKLKKQAKGRGRRFRLEPPEDAVEAVYQFLVEEASIRLAAINRHVASGGRSCRKIHGGFPRSRGFKCVSFSVTSEDKCGGRPTIADMAHEFGVSHKRARMFVCQAQTKIVKEGYKLPLEVPDVGKFRALVARELLLPKYAYYFASGSASPGEIAGAAELGDRIGAGVTVNKCREGTQCFAGVMDLIWRKGVKVFVDSGAFEEVAVKGGKLKVVSPIGDEAWIARLETYLKIARVFGGRAHVVAPDRVGSQSDTLKRLKAYRDQMALVIAKGAKILVPVQRGSKSASAFYKQAKKALGTREPQCMPAFPMKKGAYSLEELLAFVRKEKPHEIHLLGLGPGGSAQAKKSGSKKVDASEVLRRVHEISPQTKIYMDSVLVRSGAGRGFLSLSPNVYTQAQDVVRFELIDEAFQKSWFGGQSMENWIKWVQGEGGYWGDEPVIDYTNWIFEGIDIWFPQDFRELIPKELKFLGYTGLPPKSLAVDSPYDYLSKVAEEYDLWADQSFSFWLDRHFAAFLGSLYAVRRKRDAIPLAWQQRDLEAFLSELPSLEAVVPYVMFQDEGDELEPFVVRFNS